MMFFEKKEAPLVISIGGSLIVPNGGIDYVFLTKLNRLIRKQVKKGRRFFIVAGGGKTARHYRDAGKAVVGSMSNEDLDWLGIHSTRLNAHLLRTIFSDIAHPRIIENYNKKLSNWREPVVVGSGWKPGWSTDYDTVILAHDYKAKVIINLSNIDYVYDKDPKKFKDAQIIEKLTWVELEKIVGDKWTPGLNSPFDPIALQLAKKFKLTAIVANGYNFKNLERIINGESFIGTVVRPFNIDAGYYDRDYYFGKKGEYRRLGYAKSFLGTCLQTIINYYRAFLIKFFINPKNCLDVGCGTGYLVKTLRRLGIDAYGVEISKDALTLADEEVKPFLKEGDILKLPYKRNSFDLVLTFDVMEHIERSKIKRALNETIRVSRKHILHKIYTVENSWIEIFHAADFSHLSVFNRNWWGKVFKSLKKVHLLKKSFFRLPSFFETIFLLKKKN